MVDDGKPASELFSSFERSRDQAAHDKTLQETFDHRQTEIKIGEGKLDPENTAKFVNEARVAKGGNTEEKRKERRAHDHHMLMVTLERLREDLRALEAELVEKYGEDFAENLAAELLDEKTYGQLMLISDQDERRRQIAIEINRGLSDGSIDPSALDEYSDFSRWLEASDDFENQRHAVAAQRTSLELGLRRTADDAMLKVSEAEFSAADNMHDNAQNASLSTGLDSIFK